MVLIRGGREGFARCSLPHHPRKLDATASTIDVKVVRSTALSARRVRSRHESSRWNPKAKDPGLANDKLVARLISYMMLDGKSPSLRASSRCI